MARVLVVDDDAMVRRIVGWTLWGEGHEVELAGTGGEALGSLQKRAPDAIVLDLVLPDIDGREVYHRLRGRGIAAPVLILSAFGAHRAQRELGADDSLAKPFDPEDLLSRIDSLLARRHQ